MMTIEEGVREGIAEIFWGRTSLDSSGSVQWDWTGTKPACEPPSAEELLLASPAFSDGKLMTYTQYCKEVVKDKKARK